MKRLLFVFAFMAVALTACPQKADQTFTAPVLFQKSVTMQDTLFLKNGTYLLTAPSGTGQVTWSSIVDKPMVFPPAVHDHDALYKPKSYVPTWAEITGKPQEIPLPDAIEQLGYLPIPAKTTAEINALILPAGKSGIVKDKTLNVYKLWDGVGWSKIVITSN